MTFQAMDNTYSLRGDAKQQREILRYITSVGSSLRLQMDVETLLKQVAKAACEALQFQYSTLYLAEPDGLFHVRATSGLTEEQESYLHEHPLPGEVVTRLFDVQYRISDSYFIPGESPFWQDEVIAKHFVIIDDEQDMTLINAFAEEHYEIHQWRATDMILVPLVNADNTLLGFLNPDAPLDGLRPDVETITYFELFANQAAVVIEGSRLYREAKQNSEERAALLEIGRVLSSPEALHDTQTLYRTIHEQVERIMPVDAFFFARFDHKANQLFIEYLFDQGQMYAPIHLVPLWLESLLSDERALYFYTRQEYEAFTNGTPELLRHDYVGTMLPSESLIFIPVLYGETGTGVLSVQSYRPHVYTQRHVQMLQEIAVQVGIALTNAQLYTELREAVRVAQESEQMKNHFLMTASHELRTPLTAIQGYLELLSMHDDMLDETNRIRFMHNARRAADEVMLLLSNVMDTGHIDQNNVVLYVSPIPVVRAVRLVLDIMEPAFIREQRQVEVHIDEDVLAIADEARLRQVLLNIVGNALKYTQVGTSITLSSSVLPWNELVQRMPERYHTLHEQSDTTLYTVLAVRDRGAGIPLEHQEQLFERFVRLQDATTRRQRGSGLGLYLCRQLTEAMNGCIWVESKAVAGEGTTFLIALPHEQAGT